MAQLVRASLSLWQSERRWEARERSYNLVFVHNGTIAMFFNRTILCYVKEYNPETGESK